MAATRRHIGKILVAILVGAFRLSAQEVPPNAQEVATDCAAIFSNAEIEFAAGRFYSIPGILKDCLEKDRFSNEQKVRVFELLAQVYLLTDEPLEAEKSYIQLLNADPEFVATEGKDPIDMVYLSKKFTTTPIFTPHYKVGATLSSYSTVWRVNTFTNPDEIKIDNTTLPGLTLGGGIEWNINDNLGLGTEAFVSYKTYRSNTSAIFADDVLEVTEKQTWIDIPLYFRYGYHVGKVRPYAYAGYALNLLVRNKLTQSAQDIFPGENSEETNRFEPIEGPDDNIRYKRNFLNRSLVFGGGIKYKIKENFLLLDIRYMPGQSNVTNKKTNFYAKEGDYVMDRSLTKYGNVSDFFRVNSWAFSVGYVVPLYDPRKIKKANTKSVSRKISKQSKNEK